MYHILDIPICYYFKDLNEYIYLIDLCYVIYYMIFPEGVRLCNVPLILDNVDLVSSPIPFIHIVKY